MNAKTLSLFLVVAVLSAVGGWLASSHVATRDPSQAVVSANGPCPGGAAPLFWKAPMDPTYVRDAPGKSPMGMDLVPECATASNAGRDDAIVIDAATVQNTGVRTTPVVRRDLSRAIRAVGRVAYDERRVTHVHTKVQGWIENLFVDFVGQEVKRGQPLLEIYSPALVATQEELLLAARYRDTTGESPFEDVRGGGESLFAATRQRLALWDIPDRDIRRLLETGEVNRTLTLYAPAAGVVTRLGVRSGMEVKPNSNLYTIADLSKVWVLADVYEYELPWLELGQEAQVEISYLPGEPMRGKLTYIAPFLDPKTRTAEVRLELDNAAGKLKPEMFGNAVIEGAPRPNAIAIPAEAVLRSGIRTIAVIALGQGRFEPRDIEIGLDAADGWLEVRSGLREGEQVVVSSQFLIDSESNLQEAVKKLLATLSEKKTGSAMDPSAHSGHRNPTDPDESSYPAGREGQPRREGSDRSGTPTAPTRDHSSMEKE